MGQHVLDGAGRRGNTKNEHQGESFDIAAAGWRTMIHVAAFHRGQVSSHTVRSFLL